MPDVPDTPDHSKLLPRMPDLLKGMPTIEPPDMLIPPSPLLTNVKDNYASEFHRRLVDWINTFNESLDQQHEVGVQLVNFGQTIVFHLDDIGYWNPSLISFSGRAEEGNPVKLIQHVSQISVLLTILPRRQPDKPRRKIGFHEEDEEPDSPALGHQ